MNKSKVAFCGIIVALSLLMMFLTGVFPLLDYSLPALAGMLLVVIVIEINFKFALIVYIATAILSLFITPNKDSSALYIMFFGYYPILKGILEKIKSIIIEWVLKIIIFNSALSLLIIVSYYLFNLKQVISNMGTIGTIGIISSVIISNMVFVIYDIAITRVAYSYQNWFKPKYLKHIK